MYRSSLTAVAGVLAALTAGTLALGQSLTPCSHAWEYWRTPGVAAPPSAVTVFRGELYVSIFQREDNYSPSGQLGRWDGRQWHEVVTSNTQSISESSWITALGVLNDELIAIGGFTEIGGVPCNGMAAWNGQTWRALGDGSHGVDVDELVEYNGELYVGNYDGYYTSGIIHFDGQQWQELSLDAYFGQARVNDILVWDGKLLVAGEFYDSNYLPMNSIQTWDGTTFAPYAPTNFQRVVVLGTYQGKLAAAGQHWDWSRRVGLWDGQQWTTIPGNPSGVVFRLGETNDALVAGGWFLQIDGQPMGGLARWDGQSWSRMTTSGWGGGDLAVIGDSVYIWTTPADALGEFEGLRCNRIARWKDGSWWPLGLGVERIPSDYPAAIKALTWYQGQLVAAGDFSHAGGVPVNNIATFDGQRWHAFDSGFNGAVSAVAVYQGDLIAGGVFTQAGLTPIRHVARWDGAHWQALGTGVDDPNSLGVRMLALYQNRLVVGGHFTSGGGVPAPGIAAWDGQAWSSFGGGLSVDGSEYYGVFAGAEYQGDFVAGGLFYPEYGAPSRNLARWNGTQWSEFGRPSRQVVAMVADGADLYVAGAFQTMNGEPCNALAHWDGAAWHALDVGLEFPSIYDISASSLAFHEQSLVAGGKMSAANGSPANGLVRLVDGMWEPIDVAPGKRNALWSAAGTLFLGASTYYGDAKFTEYSLAAWAPVYLPGDMNCDGTVDFADIDLFVAALSYPNGAGWPNECPWENGDCNGDNAVDFADIDAFVGLLFTTCP